MPYFFEKQGLVCYRLL